MAGKDPERVIVQSYIGVEERFGNAWAGINNYTTVDDRQPGKNNRAVVKFGTIFVKRKIIVWVIQLFLYITDVIIITGPFGRGVKFLQAKHIGILLFQQLHHF